MKYFNHFSIFVISFIYMSFEMVSSRLTAPFFGDTIYTWGAIITIFLLGSTFGYLLGGWASDQKKSYFYMILFFLLSIISVSLVPIVASFLFPVLQNFSLTTGILLGSFSIFFLPNFFLSCLIPMFMKLDLEGNLTGTKIGFLHTSSALGSVIGTLITTFYFIPNFHISILFVSYVVSMISILAVILFSLKQKFSFVILSICILFISFPLFPYSVDNTNSSEKVVGTYSSPYHDIFITETSSYNGQEGHFRFMKFNNGGYQGGIDLSNPDRLLIGYAIDIYDVYTKAGRTFESVVVIGHGVGTLPQAMTKNGSDVEVAEIDPFVLKASQDYFSYPFDNVYIEDGRRFLQKKNDDSVDMLVLDAYSGGKIPFHLITDEFFDLSKKKLSSDGVLVMNLIGIPKDDEVTNSIISTIQNNFEYVSVFSRNPEAHSLQNLIITASPSPIQIDNLSFLKKIQVGSGEIIYDGETKFIEIY